MTRIAVVTDSNSQIPVELADRYGIAVVPMPVVVDGVDHLEGVDLDAEGFYDRFAQGVPVVATTQPSPGQFLEVYRALADAGAEAVLSVHIGSKVSGTVNSARVAASAAGLEVRIVDTGTASFAVALCAWSAAEALAEGAGLDEAARRAEAVAARTANVFVVGGLALARAGGRLAGGPARSPGLDGTIPVLSMRDGVMEVLGEVDDQQGAAVAMAEAVRGGGHDLRVGVGHADRDTLGLRDAVVGLLEQASEVREVIRYRVGPSVGVHTGPGTVGVMWARW